MTLWSDFEILSSSGYKYQTRVGRPPEDGFTRGYTREKCRFDRPAGAAQVLRSPPTANRPSLMAKCGGGKESRLERVKTGMG
jgi:hypothetical protein